jgi:Rho guanine nucleotide exchange factor 17
VTNRKPSNSSTDSESIQTLIISGGDGFEDFRTTGANVNEIAGREDSTNHLLMWQQSV